MIEIVATEILPSSLPPPRSAAEASDLATISNCYAHKLATSAHALERAGAPAAYALAGQYFCLVRALRAGACA